MLSLNNGAVATCMPIFAHFDLDTDLVDIHRLTYQLGYQIELERIQKHWQFIHLDPHYQTLVIESNA